VPKSIGDFKAIVFTEAIFVYTTSADGVWGMGLEVGKQINVTGFLDLGFG
jgi:hypothetical protein